MKNFAPFCAGLLILSLVSGCTSVKRFKSADYKGQDNSLVEMSLFSARLDQQLPDRSGQNLWNLSAGAQTKLIQILDERYPENGEFTVALNQEYMLDESGPPLDFTHHRLQMVYTISRSKDYTALGDGRSRFSPADRIEELKFSLELPEAYKLSFTGWNRYATEYGELALADMSFSRSISLGGDISTRAGDIDVKAESGRKEDQSVRSRYLKLNGCISPKRIEMEAEGNREIDLAGNVLAEVALKFEAFPERVFIPVFSAPGEAFPPLLMELRPEDILVPRIKELPDSIMATLEMEYIYRHVKTGWKSYQEWDDRVAYYKGRVEKQVLLFNKSDYLPLLYCLGTDGEEKETLKIRTASGKEYPLQFFGYREANRFLKWLQLKDSVHKTGANTLLWNGQSITSEMLLSIKELKVIPRYK